MVIEAKGVSLRDQLRKDKVPKSRGHLLFTDDEITELRTRTLVKERFSALLGNRLSAPDLEALGKVLFGILYPSLEEA